MASASHTDTHTGCSVLSAAAAGSIAPAVRGVGYVCHSVTLGSPRTTLLL